eukprot:8930480-Prorocentrum_lima.AAC.1
MEVGPDLGTIKESGENKHMEQIHAGGYREGAVGETTAGAEDGGRSEPSPPKEPGAKCDGGVERERPN